MKNVQQITLSGMVFSIESDAYNKLQEYLSGVEFHFNETDAEMSAEILQDIESSIAEKMLAQGKNINKAIALKDVKITIEQLGNVKDLSGDDDFEKESINKNKRHRLYRDTDDVMIAGVASGLAKYVDIDVAIVRILFVIGAFIHTIGIWMYIVLWIAVRKAETPSEKMAMRGAGVSLESIRSFMDKKIQDVPKDSRDGVKGAIDSASFIVKQLLNFVRKLFPIIKTIIGVLFIIVGVVGIFGITITLLAFFQAGFNVVMDPLTAEYFGNSIANASTLSVAALYTVVFVPFWFLGILGNYLTHFKKGKDGGRSTIEIVYF